MKRIVVIAAIIVAVELILWMVYAANHPTDREIWSGEGQLTFLRYVAGSLVVLTGFLLGAEFFQFVANLDEWKKWALAMALTTVFAALGGNVLIGAAGEVIKKYHFDLWAVTSYPGAGSINPLHYWQANLYAHWFIGLGWLGSFLKGTFYAILLATVTFGFALITELFKNLLLEPLVRFGRFMTRLS